MVIEDMIEDKRASWFSIKSNFKFDDSYLEELGLSEKMKKEIKDG